LRTLVPSIKGEVRNFRFDGRERQHKHPVQPCRCNSFAPSGTPADVITKLNVAVAKAVQDEALTTAFAKFGVAPRTSSVPATAAFLRAISQHVFGPHVPHQNRRN